MFLRLLVVTTLIAYAVAKEVPSYIKPCRLVDAKFEECALKSGNDAISNVIKGDEQYKVVSHVPLVLPEVTVQATAGLVMKLKDVEIYFQEPKLTAFKLDSGKKTLDLTVVDDVDLKGNYDVNGRILLLPLNGTGRFNLSLEQKKIEYSSNYELVKKDGHEYIKILSDYVKSSSLFASFYLDNLFGGNKQLGAEINKALNENWRELLGEFRPATNKVWAAIVHGALVAYLESIPFDQLFL